MKRARGTSLVELMVVVFLFALLMTLILGFYVEATRFTRRRDAMSTRYRRVSAVLDRIETQVQNARIHYAGNHQLIFVPLLEPAVVHAATNWDPTATTLFFEGGRLQQRRNGTSYSLMQLEAGESIDFEDGGNYVDVVFSGPKGFRVTRRIQVELY